MVNGRPWFDEGIGDGLRDDATLEIVDGPAIIVGDSEAEGVMVVWSTSRADAISEDSADGDIITDWWALKLLDGETA